MRRRLDIELVRRGLVPSRRRATEAVSEGRVLVAGAPATSPARQVAPGEPIVVTRRDHDYASRGGVKLAAALDAFGIDARGRRAVDVGASTGGFTDVLLRRGARHVVAIDVGRGQLAWNLRNDPRVTVMERTNVRDLGPGSIGAPADLCVADVSFISLRTIVANLLAIATGDADFVLLVKPQFEAGPARVGRGGIVRDPEVRDEVVREVVGGLGAAGIEVRGRVESPIRGAGGNVEHFVHGQRSPTNGSDP